MDINNTEVSFLNWCGFNTDNGYYQDDINCLKKLYPEAWLLFLSGKTPNNNSYSVEAFFNTWKVFPVEGELYTLGKEQYKIVNLTYDSYDLIPVTF